jgi:hypothetical protein
LIYFAVSGLSELDKNQDVNVQVCIDSVVCAGSVPQEIVSAQEHLSDFEANPTNGKIGKTLYQSHLRIQKAKIALNCGQQHMTSKGTLRLARCLKRSCQDKCKKCQSPRLTLEERTNINRMFWNLGEHQKQWEFIKSSVVISKPKKKFACTGAKGEKSQSRTYTFSVEGKARKVCKTMFKSTLSICDSWVDSALTHFSDFSGVVVDRRGKHNNRPKRGLKKRQNEKQSFNA